MGGTLGYEAIVVAAAFAESSTLFGVGESWTEEEVDFCRSYASLRGVWRLRNAVEPFF